MIHYRGLSKCPGMQNSERGKGRGLTQDSTVRELSVILLRTESADRHAVEINVHRSQPSTARTKSLWGNTNKPRLRDLLMEICEPLSHIFETNSVLVFEATGIIGFDSSRS